MAFRFPLDPLLRLRRRNEREKQRAVAALEARRAELEATIRRRQADLHSGKATLREALVGRVDVRALRLQAQSAMSVRRQADALVLQLAGVHRSLEKARAELIAAAKDRRALELLREKREAQWREDERRAEQRLLDDLAHTQNPETPTP